MFLDLSVCPLIFSKRNNNVSLVALSSVLWAKECKEGTRASNFVALVVGPKDLV